MQLDLASESLAGRENRISQGQVLKTQQFTENENPEIYEWFISKLNDAVERRWLAA
jgi:putative hydrolase of HD superfamily